MKFSSAPISNLQFRPRRPPSGNTAPEGSRTMDVPTLTTRAGSLAIKRNARSGRMYHWAGGRRH